MALNANDIKELREDLSPFLIHLTRDGSYKKWKDIDTTLTTDQNVTITAKSSLENIISIKKIEARCPFGYFNYKVPYRTNNQNSQVKRDWLRAVCFTETPVDHIYVQCEPIEGRQLNFKPYGLAFFENSIKANGGNPVMYFNTQNTTIRGALDSIPTSSICLNLKPTLALYEGFGPPLYNTRYSPAQIDFRWEREWRIVNDFIFNIPSDVAFGICPKNEITYFEGLVGNAIKFIDPREPIGLIKKKLKTDTRLSAYF